MKERDIINEALIYSSKDMQNAFVGGVKSIKDQLPSLEGIVVEEECPKCWGSNDCVDAACKTCQGTGTITRQAEWGDIPEGLIQDGIKCISDNAFIPKTKSGGRLKVKK
jgi:DnaJ-class molecular chaperone